MARFGMDENAGDFEEQQQLREERLAERQNTQTPGEPAPTEPTVMDTIDPSTQEQQSGRDRLQATSDETEGVPTPGAPAKPRPVAKSNTPLGLGGTFAQVGSAAAGAFRSPEFFTNRVIGGGQPLRFGSGSGSSLGGAFGGGGAQGVAPGRRPGLNEDELMMAIQAAGGGFTPFGG